MGMAYSMDTKIPQFNLDGLRYDATMMLLNGKAVPIATGEKISYSREGASFSLFTSARGIQSVMYRGTAPRSISVGMQMPWKYCSMIANLESSQREPLYVITPLARRSNVLPPWKDWYDVWSSANTDILHKVSLGAPQTPASSIVGGFDRGVRLDDINAVETFYNKTGRSLYGRRAEVIAGTTCRFRVGVRTDKPNERPIVRLSGYDKTGRAVWTSPTVTAKALWDFYVTEPFVIPNNVETVRDVYDGGIVEFSLIQLWIGEHVPPPSPRLGGTFQISDLTFDEEPISTTVKRHNISFTLKEVG